MKKGFRKMFEEAEQDPAFWAELASLEVTEEIHAAMERSGVTRSELARRLGTSPAYVTKILRGNANFTLESLARVTRALGSKIRFHIAPAESKRPRAQVPPLSAGALKSELGGLGVGHLRERLPPQGQSLE